MLSDLAKQTGAMTAKAQSRAGCSTEDTKGTNLL